MRWHRTRCRALRAAPLPGPAPASKTTASIAAAIRSKLACPRSQTAACRSRCSNISGVVRVANQSYDSVIGGPQAA